MKFNSTSRVRVRWRRGTLVASTAVAVLVGISGCSVADSDSSESTPSASSTAIPVAAKDSALAAKVPASFQGRKLTVALPDSKPYDNINADGTITGIVPDLVTQLASMLDLDVTITQTSTGAVVTGVQSGKIDLSAPTGDFVERESSVDFTDFAQSHEVLLVSRSAGYSPANVTDLCGKTIGVTTGTATVNTMTDVTSLCKQKGKTVPTVNAYSSQSQAVTALQSGRVDGALLPLAPAAQAVAAQRDKLKSVDIEGLSGMSGYGGVYGFVTAKGSGMAEVLQQALQKLYDDGTYQAIFKKWGLPQGAYTSKSSIAVNASTLHAG